VLYDALLAFKVALLVGDIEASDFAICQTLFPGIDITMGLTH